MSADGAQTATATIGTDPDGKNLGSPCGCQDSNSGAVVANTGPAPAKADPITLSNGNVYESATDYTTTGQNPLAFTRSYNSRQTGSSFAAMLGPNWRSNYDRTIHILSPTSVMLEQADGRQLNFVLSGAAWLADNDVNIVLAQSASTWTVTQGDDTVETYTNVSVSKASVTSIKGRNGYTRTLAYTSGQLTSVTDSYGRKLTFGYTNGLLTSVATPDATTYTYGYTNGYLSSVGYPTSPASSLTYGYTSTLLTSVTDENGSLYATWAYDSQGRGVSNHMGTGSAGLTTVAYNADGSRTVTGPLGEVETYKFKTFQGGQKLAEIDRAASSTTAAATSLFAYDFNGYLASQTDWDGNQTSYANDTRGEPTNVTEANGSSIARTTSYTYHAIYHLPLTVTAPATTTTLTYDTSGNLLTKAVADTYAGTPTRTWTYSWGTTGLLASVKQPRTDVSALTGYTYDATGALTKITDALGHATQITSHTGGGRPLVMLDPNNVTTTLAYDGRQRLLSSAVTTSAGVRTTGYTYDKAGNVTKVTLPDASYRAYTYDTAHQVTQVAINSGAYKTYTRDAAGNVTAVADYNSGATTPVYQHAATFDALGRRLKDTSAATGKSVVYTYDNNGNALSVTDGNGHVTTRIYDALNRVTSMTDPANNVSTTTWVNALDKPYMITPPNGAFAAFAYNGFGQTTTRSDANYAITYWTYDLDGNVTQKSDSANHYQNWTYDALDRPLTATYPNDAAENVAFTYDQSGHGFGIGRLTSLTDAVGTLSDSWDERGNELSESRVVGGVPLKTGYTYDTVGRVASIVYPSGWSAVYGYDVSGKVAWISANQGSNWPQVVNNIVWYGVDGPHYSMFFGNYTVSRWYNYDLDYRVTGVNDNHNGTRQFQAGYGYDYADNVTSVTDPVVPANNQTYTYDALDRLLTASATAVGATNPSGAYTWTYDKVGNRLSEQVGALPASTWAYYNGGPGNYLQTYTPSGGTAQNVYSDGIGNITQVSSSGSTASFSYTQTNQMATSSVTGAVAETLAYDYRGQQVTRTLAGSPPTVMQFQYDRQGHLLEELSGGVAKADYLYLGDMPIATITPATGAVSFLLDDRLNTPRVATDSTGVNVLWKNVTTPFGIPGTSGSLQQNLRFPGQNADPNAGWVQNGFRDYMPAWGRYLEVDPIRTAGGVNTFGYVNQNPLRYVDPKGLQAEGEGGGSEEDPVLIEPTGQLLEPLKNQINQANAAAEAAAAAETVPQPQMSMSQALNPPKECTGDLTKSEIAQIQSVVDQAGRPLEVVGSAARGGRGPDSDIDYLTPPSSIPFFEPFQGSLPGIDPSHGIVPGYGNIYQGPVVRFEPK